MMCGITGWVEWDQDLRQHEVTINKMAQTLGKRGPDSLTNYRDTHAALGHTRLIVVDPAGGRQPMTKIKDGNAYTIVYNGELYNTEELRKELIKRGYTFKSHSDTEVLLTAYVEWKEDCVYHLNGIYAFAVWDPACEKLYMARDRLGVKPLFYHYNGNRLLFGSELKAILAHPEMKAEIDREGLQELFGLGPSRTPGHGVFRGISELRPAHFLIFDRSGLTIRRYWNVNSENHVHSLDETIEHVRFLIKDAVERQLVADVPVCTFLSGGLDSSAITAIASNYFKKQGRGTLHTYSIDYEENSHYFQKSLFQPDEDRPWIEKTVQYLGVAHHQVIVSHEELAEKLKDAVIAKDLPGMADIDSSLLMFSDEVKKQFTVALSGECADEIFGGYPWFYKEELLRGEGFPWMQSMSARENLLLPFWKEKLKLKEYVKQRYEETIREVPALEGEHATEARRREIFYLNMIWFMTTLLDRKDRMSMAASLEVRVPFADHRIVEYAWNIPWTMKMLDGREKGLLRKAMEGILPKEIIYRKKSPYPKTHHPKYTKLVKEMLRQILQKENSPILEFVSKEKLEKMLDTNESPKFPWFGQLMAGPQLIAHLVQMNMWFNLYNVNYVD
ncbi:asparagine synthase (glutamine-hydrolyzing) [Ureibacillus sp. FSL K6-8385]|mgnify:CR=1 FL=1|nr:asparagine synthase (glutamine-hydrolyzing) [Ureibacillus terrenus]MED3662634.1 asparagine synthase (glutamine-hydrolyzing) [Ureibacillus terrenus]MED3764914.1 asparagine synthase (glutamine-hydrolyzing) [Ureibacillus terrenus]